jgi:LPS O-antigen subunit length determinant protein (WzzB/FepE family)
LVDSELKLNQVEEKIEKVMIRYDPSDPVTRQNPVKNLIATR